MEVGEDTLDHMDILRLYEDPRFPATGNAKRQPDRDGSPGPE
jgi:hypothetical protein